MKKFSRILVVVLTFMLVVAGMASSFSVSAAGIAERFECDITIDKIKNGQFEYMAYDIANQMFYSLEEKSKATWSPDWPGHFVPNKEVYTVSKSEHSEGLVDMMCDGERNWGSVVVFTAPKAGKYNIVTELDKFSGVDGSGKVCYVDIKLVKGGDGTVLASKEKVDFGEIDLKKLNVQLAENEKVYVLITYNAASTKYSSQNVALKMFYVTLAAEEETTPSQTTDPNETDSSGGSNIQETTDPDNGGSSGNDDVQVTTGSNNGGDNGSDGGVNPIVIVAIAGGVLLLAAIAVVVILRVTKKK